MTTAPAITRGLIFGGLTMKPNKRLLIGLEATRKRHVWNQKTDGPTLTETTVALAAFQAPLVAEIAQAERYLSELHQARTLMGW